MISPSPSSPTLPTIRSSVSRPGSLLTLSSGSAVTGVQLAGVLNRPLLLACGWLAGWTRLFLQTVLLYGADDWAGVVAKLTTLHVPCVNGVFLLPVRPDALFVRRFKPHIRHLGGRALLDL